MFYVFSPAVCAAAVTSHFADDVYGMPRSVTVDPHTSLPSSYEPEHAPRKRGKFTRSKTGCLTCRTKKVKVRVQARECRPSVSPPLASATRRSRTANGVATRNAR